MIIEIGIVAGEIWGLLEKEGQLSLSALVSSIEQPRDVILMSLGWLAREKHVILQKSGEEYLVSLRERVSEK